MSAKPVEYYQGAIADVRAADEVGNKEHAKLARQVADESIVLLKNKDNILPLDPATSAAANH